MMRVVVIVGTRPNLVKLSALWRALQAPRFSARVVHTRQQDDPAMFQELLEDLELPPPDVALAPCRGGRAAQIRGMLPPLRDLLARERPDLVVVIGDVNSTAAGALAARGARVPLAHVEAGLRSFDRAMPEELNRVLADRLSALLFASEPSGVENLRRERRHQARIHLAGNVLIDALVRMRARIGAAGGAPPERGHAVVTLHRPRNVDDPDRLGALVDAVVDASRRLPIVLPLHPRTRDRLARSGHARRLERAPNVHVRPPLVYSAMVRLLEGARVVITDSGGLQEESTFLGVPCLTLRVERAGAPDAAFWAAADRLAARGACPGR